MSTTLSEDVVFAVGEVRRNEVGHIFDYAEDRDIDLVEHLQAFSRIDEGKVIRGRHDDGSRQRRLLSQCQCCISRSWRKVDDQIIKFSPDDVG